MPEISEKELPANAKALWDKALHAVQVSNLDYAITLIQGVLEQAPGFLDGRKLVSKCELQKESGQGPKKKGGLFGSGMGGMKIQSHLKKNPESALPLIEKELAKAGLMG